ncbi:MAG TPA: hypothetical protein VLV89_00700, partial [Candidatus Acidoferrum sp.]|nr:hypothetical protein [Candidatus Acidoferrum sp.]
MKNVKEELLVQEGQLSELVSLASETSRTQFFEHHPDLIQAETVRRLAEIVVRRIRVDTQEALRYSDAAIELANRLKDKKSLAFGLRAKANALYAKGDNKSAIKHHEDALHIFEALEEWNEAGRT